MAIVEKNKTIKVSGVTIELTKEQLEEINKRKVNSSKVRVNNSIKITDYYYNDVDKTLRLGSMLTSTFTESFRFNFKKFRWEDLDGNKILPSHIKNTVSNGIRPVNMSEEDTNWTGLFLCELMDLSGFYKDVPRTKALHLINTFNRYETYLKSIEKVAKYLKDIPLSKTRAYAYVGGDTLKDILRMNPALAKVVIKECNFNKWTNISYTIERVNKLNSIIQLIDLPYCGDLVQAISNDLDIQDILDLTDKGYDLKSLLDYLFLELPTKQGFALVKESLRMVNDCVNMQIAIYNKIRVKYPKYLKTQHDVWIYHFNKIKVKIDEKKFKESYKGKNLEWHPQGEKYCVSTPRTPDELIEEGKNMCHCVGSYVDKIIDSNNHVIVFMRGSSYPRERVATVEIKDSCIIQARGKYNRNLSQEEHNFLSKYAKEKNFEMRVY